MANPPKNEKNPEGDDYFTTCPNCGYKYLKHLPYCGSCFFDPTRKPKGDKK
jgi:uncharacterized OB-fold protein